MRAPAIMRSRVDSSCLQRSIWSVTSKALLRAMADLWEWLSFVSRLSTVAVAALFLFLLSKMFWSWLTAIRLLLATAVSPMLLGLF